MYLDLVIQGIDDVLALPGLDHDIRGHEPFRMPVHRGRVYAQVLGQHLLVHLISLGQYLDDISRGIILQCGNNSLVLLAIGKAAETILIDIIMLVLSRLVGYDLITDLQNIEMMPRTAG